jgi:hypothetical protein
LVPPQWGWAPGREAFWWIGPGRPSQTAAGNLDPVAERRRSDGDA